MVYALHESLEVHEMAAFKTVCLTKSKTMKALVSDPELKAIMQQDVDLSTRQLQELSAILNKASQQETKA
jgi:spore coat protein CotF